MSNNGNRKSWEDAVEQAYHQEQLKFCTDYLQEHRPGYLQLSENHYEARMANLEWARLSLLKIIKEDE